MADRCRHEMTVGTCADCDGRDGGERERKARDADLLARRRAVKAEFGGACGGCGEHYGPGTPISKRGGDTDWFASCCLDDHGAPIRARG